MKLGILALITLLATTTTGCTYMVAKDYPTYLNNNQGQLQAVTLTKTASYDITNQTLSHSHNVKSFMAGAANTWVVEVGKMLDETLKSSDYATTFVQGQEAPLEVSFDLESYDFKNFQTYITLAISVKDGGKLVHQKTYTIVGKNQSGKVLIGGAFAMKNAIQQSTKFALDDLLKEFLSDLKSKNIAIRAFTPKMA